MLASASDRPTQAASASAPPSSGSTEPPGKTKAPPTKSEFRLRRTISTSSVRPSLSGSGASRTSITVAAWRSDIGSVAGGDPPGGTSETGGSDTTPVRLPVGSGPPPKWPKPWSTLMPPMSLDAPEKADSPVVHAIPRRYAALGVIVLAIILVGALIVIRNHDNQANGTSDVETITPAPAS